MLTCRGCKTDFIPSRKGQKYHSRECYQKSETRLIICPDCGIEFKRKFSKQVCCSPECAIAYRAKKKTKGVYVKCAFDDKAVYRMHSRVRKLNFCDNHCKISYLRSDKNKESRKHTPEEKEKIRQANFRRDYSTLSSETRQKFRRNARKTILRAEIKEKTRKINSQRLSGSTLKETTKQKIIANAKYGEDNAMWKGNFASYPAMHMYVTLHKGKAENYSCVDFNFLNMECKGRLEWSNVNHKYTKELNNYTPRCTRHHRIYDKLHGLINPKGVQKRTIPRIDKKITVVDFTVDGIVVEEKNNSNYL